MFNVVDDKNVGNYFNQCCQVDVDQCVKEIICGGNNYINYQWCDN